MVKIFSADDRVRVYFLKNILEEQGIACTVKNDHSMSLAGEVPVVECWPELWLLDDDKYPVAKEVVDDFLVHPEEQGAEWVCQECGERHGAQFTACWNCGWELK